MCADQGYASDAVYSSLAGRAITAFIAPQPNMLGRPGGQAARARCKSPSGVSAAIDRTTHGEGAISELKLQHALDRARCRGTTKLQTQLLLAATAVNLKRLTSRPPAAENADDGDPGAAIGAHLLILDACLNQLRQLEDPVLRRAPSAAPASASPSTVAAAPLT